MEVELEISDEVGRRGGEYTIVVELEMKSVDVGRVGAEYVDAVGVLPKHDKSKKVKSSSFHRI